MVIDLSGLPEAMKANGYSFEKWRSSYPFAVFGSRAAKCHRPDSDWDVVVLGQGQSSDRGGGLDFLVEDPPNDSHWYVRDLAFHLTGYAVWLNSGPNWDPALLQWDRAIERKTKRVREIALSLGRLEMAAPYQKRWMRKCVQEAGRIMQLREGLHISPTSMLPRPSLEDFRGLGVDASFLLRLETLQKLMVTP
jgi:hypothetical protein